MQHLWNIQTDKCSCNWDRSGFSSCGLCGHIHMRVGPGQSLSSLHSSHSRSRWTTTARAGTWPQWICTNGLVKTTPESHQGHLLAYPRLWWDWEQCQQQCTLWARTTGKRWHNRAHSQVNISRGGILRGFSPSGSASIPPTSHCRSETQLRNRSLGLYFNN